MNAHNKKLPITTKQAQTDQQDLPANIPEKKQLATVFNRSFWGVIILFILITGSLYIIGTLNKNDEALELARNVQLISDESLEKMSPIMAKVYRKLDFMDYPDEFKQDVSDSVDKAFVPVYANVSKFADLHYSVKGAYVELFSYAAGDLERKIQDILFEEFNDSALASQINILLTDTLKSMAVQTAQKEIEVQGIPVQDQQVLKQIIDQTIKNQISNFRSAQIVGFGAAGAASGAALTKTFGGTAGIIAKRLSQKLATKMVTKFAVKKAGSVLTSVATGVAAGAAGGSVFPVVGTAVGGAIGAVIGWIGVDSAFVAADEYLNRDEFEKTLINLITEQKNQLKKQLLQQAIQIKAQLSKDAQTLIQGKSPAEILKETKP